MTRPCLGPLGPIAATSRPFTPPPGSCDCHTHVFGPYERFPLADDRSYTPPANPPEHFIEHLDGLGFERGVVVTASVYGTDNASLMNALHRYPDRLRGVAVVDETVSESALDRMTEAGVQGARFNLYRHEGQAVYRNGAGLDALLALAPRLAARGWHAQIWIHASDLPELRPILTALPVDLVVDHMGRMNVSRGVDDAGFQCLVALLAEGRAWSKISGADRLSAAGAPYDDVAPLATALLAANPERIVWGSDWPHVNYFEAERMPDDGDLLAQAGKWLPDEASRQRVFVDNPARLYGFEPGPP